MKLTIGHTLRHTLAAVALGALLVAAGCGSSDTSEPLASEPPVTDTETTVPMASDPPVTDPPTTVPATPEPEGTDPPVTEPPTTVPVASDPPVTDPAPTEGGRYEPAGRGVAPSFDGTTDPIVDPLPDGIYWSWNYAPAGDTVVFTLVQYFFGDACIEQFGSADECPSDNNTLETPNAVVELDTDVATASVISADDEGGFAGYRVSVEEFVRLVSGAAPAADAPEGYTFVPFATVVTVRDGRAVAADQIFTS